jgi:hypothetical protein
MTGKTLDTLVEDIYQFMKDKNAPEGVDIAAEIDKFTSNMKATMEKEFLPSKRSYDGRKLRLSSIGKQDLQQWFSANKFSGEKLLPKTLIKFMYGHIVEEFILMLVRMTGHEVTDEQKEVSVGGIKGHMDCKIDGVTIDVKSTTKFGIKDFQNGTLAMNDGFGYVDQVKAYAHAEGETKFGWLAMCKQNGTLAVLTYDLKDKNNPMYKHYSGDIEERVKHVKKLVELPDRPSRCSSHIETFYGQQEDGKSGNLKLSTGCSYCKYKKHCYPEVRGWYTGGGPKFLTTVINIPKNKHGVPQQEINLNRGEVDYG